MGSAPGDLESVSTLGFSAWIDDQIARPQEIKIFDWLTNAGYTARDYAGTYDGFEGAVWKQLISSGAQLRQRMGCALLSFLVVGVNGLHTTLSYSQFATGHYMDILWENAFGNFRTLLEKITLSAAMGGYLTYLGNAKATAAGAVPDENYARELMQLFTIGLYQLNMDGTQKLVNGAPIETYVQADVIGLARVFTGWNLDNPAQFDPAYTRRPLVQQPELHELGAKTFLGTTIPAGTDAVTSLKIALDTVFNHANTPPFVCKQLIQRLVTSNPSPAYVERVANVFVNNGARVRGDLRAVVRAVLLDAEARDDAAAAASVTFGKLREPVMRYTAFARAFSMTSPTDKWTLGDTSAPDTRLGQAIGHSPSVFNWFRPGYVPPNTSIATAKMVAPEFQMANEPSVIGYINFLMYYTQINTADINIDYSVAKAKVNNAQDLLDYVNVMVAGSQVSAATLAQFKPAVESIAALDSAGIMRKVWCAVMLIMTCPEFIIQK